MQKLKDINFSLWCDFIEREFLESDFKDMIKKGIVNGATSNPAIFKDAFLNSSAYKEDIKDLKDKSPKEIYETLAIKDIKRAATIMEDIHKQNSNDGFISIEIDPLLCDDYENSLKEAKRLYESIGMDNVMIKVPATDAGYKVMKDLMAVGINVNATLVFSLDQTKKIVDAFKEGTEEFQKVDLDKTNPKGVISIFVSRFDRKLNSLLKEKSIKQNIVGIYNATKIYNYIEKNCSNYPIRALFASTGVKGDDLKKDYYIKGLLYKNAINTAPLNAIEYFFKNDDLTIEDNKSDQEIDKFLDSLAKNQIDLNKVSDELLQEGLEAFKIAFAQILKELEKG